MSSKTGHPSPSPSTLTPSQASRMESNRLAALALRNSLALRRAAGGGGGERRSRSVNNGKTYELVTGGYEGGGGGEEAGGEEEAFDRVKGIGLGDGDGGGVEKEGNKNKSKKRPAPTGLGVKSTAFLGERMERQDLLDLDPSLPLLSSVDGGCPAMSKPLVTQSDAGMTFLVPKSDLITLPYAPAKNTHGDGTQESRLVRVDQVRELCLRRFGSWAELEKERGARERRKADRIREELMGGKGKGNKRRKKLK